MATIDLTGVTNSPYIRRATGVATTWQEVSFPGWVTKVSVQPDSDVYVAMVGAETPTDGGSVGSHFLKVASGGSATLVIRDCDDNPTTVGVTKAGSIFVAAATGTADLTVVLESGRD
jgi:hypothetical protein|tara:strand:+ start:2527 stop:2877 length:351 start_codon:yes stop_codon:yes gene_type:complete